MPDGFLFDDSRVITVDVDMSDRLDEPAYLLICSNFEPDGASYSVDYGACQLNTALAEGQFRGDLKLSGAVDDLLAVILPIEHPDDALYVRWNGDQGQGTFRVR